MRKIIDFNFMGFSIGDLALVEESGGRVNDLEKSVSSDNYTWDGTIEIDNVKNQREILKLLLNFS